MKSALRGSPSAVPVTKSALRASPSAVRATKSALRASPSAAPVTKSALRGSPSAAPATKSAHRGSQNAAPATKSAHRGSQSAVPATKSANEPHVQKSRFTAPVTKSELLDDHHHVQSAAPATKTVLRSKTAPMPRKVITMYQNARVATTRAQSRQAPAAGPQIQRSKHTRCSLTVRTPQCAHTVWGKKIKLRDKENKHRASKFRKKKEIRKGR